MKPILKSAIIICLLFACMQVNAQTKPKKPVNNMHLLDSLKPSKTKTGNNMLVTNENVSARNKRPKTTTAPKSLTINSGSLKTPVKTNTKTSTTKTVKHQ